MSTLRFILRSIVASFILSVIVHVTVIIPFFGISTIDVTDLEGRTLHVPAVIDGVEVGTTPYSERLGFGIFTLAAKVPDGLHAETGTSCSMLTSGFGSDCNIVMSKIVYTVVMVAPEGRRLDFLVTDVNDKDIGSCDGESCTIPLPGPGDYQAKAFGEGYQGGFALATLTPTQPTYTISWKE